MTKIKCPVCEHTNPPGRKDCEQCGAPLPQVRVQAQKPAEHHHGHGQSGGHATFRKGQLVANRYTIIDVVGKGGMGCIYKVYDNTLKEQVALKTLLPQYLRDKMVVERFFNEARIARQLSHPNIVRVHDIGVADQVLYISMEYLQGKSLRNMLDELLPGERMPVKQTLQIMIDLCTALEYAHQYTVHRDLKPENVMILPDGTVKLMDFGISKLMTSGKLTATAVVMGTPHYMPPEQFRDSSTVDARADIYSIGVMLYEILTGNLPTGVPKPASQIMRNIPPALDPIVAKCVEPNPADRYASAADLKQAFLGVMELLRGGTLESKGRGVRPVVQTLPLRRIAGGILIVVVIALTAVGFLGLDKRRQQLVAIAAAQSAGGTVHDAAQQLHAQYAEVAALISNAEELLANRERTEEFNVVYGRAEQLKEAAERLESRNPERAIRLSRQALECYLALINPLPEDAYVFVAPGDDPDSRGFFMARAPVSVSTFYEAQAYAAANNMRIPSRDEYERAFQTSPDALAGATEEWTRDVTAGPTDEGLPTFGSILATVSAVHDENGTPVDLEISQADYARDQRPFRCSVPIITAPEEVRRFLQ